MPDKKIQFFQFTTPYGDPLSGSFPVSDFVQRIQALRGTARYVDTPDGMRLICRVARTASPQHLALRRIRRDNLPALERGGDVSDLALAPDQNLAETTHFRFFPRNVVGMLYNHDGPRAKRLVEYIGIVAGAHVGLAPVLNRDTAQMLNRLRTISTVTLSIPTSRAQLLEDAANGDPGAVVRALREMANASMSKSLHVRAAVWGADDSRQAQQRWREFIDGVKTSPILGAFSKLTVKGRFREPNDDRIRGATVDLVNEHLAITQDVEASQTGGRSVGERSAGRAIQRAHAALLSQLEDAVTPIGQDRMTLKDFPE